MRTALLAVVLLLTGCATPPDMPLASQPGPTSAACPQPTGDAVVDWVDVVVVDGQQLLAAGPAPAATPHGPVHATTRCLVSDRVDPGYRLRDGDATALPAGTTLHEVAGFDPGFRLVADRDGRPIRYERYDAPPGARTGGDILPLDRVVGISLLSVEDAATEIGEVPADLVPSLVTQLRAAPYAEPGEDAPDRDVFLGLRLDDGTTVTRAYVSSTGLLLPGLHLPARFQQQIRELLP